MEGLSFDTWSEQALLALRFLPWNEDISSKMENVSKGS